MFRLALIVVALLCLQWTHTAAVPEQAVDLTNKPGTSA